MNNYQVQQLNDTIAFVTSIMALGFVAIMVSQTFSSEQPKRIWLVYITPEGKWGAWDISPHKPTLTLHKENPKKYLKEWAEYYYLDAEAQVQRGRFARYWISEATTRYRAIRNIQVMALPEHHSSSNITTSQEVEGTCYEDAWRFLIKEEEGELVHGTVESLGKRIGHAWVELPTGYIWEPQTKGYFSIKDFDIVASPIEDARYTVEEAAIMVARIGRHGPWTDEERAKWLPKTGIIHKTSPIEDVAAVKSGERLFAEQGVGVFQLAIERPDFELFIIDKIGDGSEVLYLKSKADEVTPIVKRLKEMAGTPATAEKIIERGRLFGYSEADINAFLREQGLGPPV